MGEIIDGAMRLNNIGRIAKNCWEWLATHYPYVHLDEFIIMPNHLHGIIEITECKGGWRTAPTQPQSTKKPLRRLIGAFKTISTKQINNMRGTPGIPFWQRNYYERILRITEVDLIRWYIRNNPTNWRSDPEHPDNKNP